jgi:hypothetical protein
MYKSPSKDLISASGTLHDLGLSGLGGLVCAFDRYIVQDTHSLVETQLERKEREIYDTQVKY